MSTKTKVGIQLPTTVAAMLAVESTAGDVQEALARFAHLVSENAGQLDKIFDRAEWNYMSQSLKECSSLEAYTIPPLSVIALELSDAHRQGRMGDRWFSKAKADKAVADLVAKLKDLTPMHAEAIGAAVRHFWKKGDIDASVEEWWTLAHRLKYWGK